MMYHVGFEHCFWSVLHLFKSTRTLVLIDEWASPKTSVGPFSLPVWHCCLYYGNLSHLESELHFSISFEIHNSPISSEIKEPISKVASPTNLLCMQRTTLRCSWVLAHLSRCFLQCLVRKVPSAYSWTTFREWVNSFQMLNLL